MARNVEVKARLVDADVLRPRIEALGASGPEELAQTDTFFNVASGRLKLRDFQDGTGELIFYERCDTAGPKLSEYHRSPVPDPGALRGILSRSLGVRATVRKKRDVYLVGRTRIHLDVVDGLGPFLEFEVVLRDGESVADGERIATDLMNVLGILPANLVSHAYVDLLDRAVSPF